MVMFSLTCWLTILMMLFVLYICCLAANMSGTLNGNDTQDVDLDVGSSDVLKCELLPIGLSNQLGGVWTARINGSVSELVSLYQNDSGVFVVPRNGINYDLTGETVVECIYSTPEGLPIHQFNRTVRINGEPFE